MTKKKHHIDTILGHISLSPNSNFGIPNPPIYRTSTILSSSMAHHRGDLPKKYTYGRAGTPTSASFENAVASIYQAETCISTCSGLSAISTAIMSVIRSGEHALSNSRVSQLSFLFPDCRSCCGVKAQHLTFHERYFAQLSYTRPKHRNLTG